MISILIIEDDELLCHGTAFALEKEGYRVTLAYNFAEGYSTFSNGGYDLILLDINLPDKDGYMFCKEIRRNSNIPVIFITANDTEQDMLQGFQLGCDDYISKPFSLDILKQRVAAVLRRIVAAKREVSTYDDITIDFPKKMVMKEAQPIKLTATEYRLLELLVRNRGQVMTRQNLLERLWDIDSNFVDENALSVNIRRLRQKLENDPKNPGYIITVFGIGYTWGTAL